MGKSLVSCFFLRHSVDKVDFLAPLGKSDHSVLNNWKYINSKRKVHEHIGDLKSEDVYGNVVVASTKL